jgi:hypothetical protein
VVVQRVEVANFADPSGTLVTAGSQAWAAAERRELRKLARTLTGGGARLVFVQIPPSPLPRECFREDAYGDPACAVPASQDPLAVRFNALLAEVVAEAGSGVFLVSVSEDLCPGGTCAPVIDGTVLRYDGSHFSAAGARWLVPRLFEKMTGAGAIPFPPRPD